MRGFVEDALGRRTPVGVRPPERIVSLVPSETESVAALVDPRRIVGCTDYCTEPAGALAHARRVGGTKGVDVDAVLALEPDLVLANQEENSRAQVEKLLARGAPVFVSFPRTVADSVAYVEALGALLHAETRPWVEEARRALAEAPARLGTRVLVPIWRDPWMTFDGRTYASSVLEAAGAVNVFSGRPRRYPLGADVGDAPATDAAGRDTRYPRFALGEAWERAPELVLLPDEPYAFGEADVQELERGWNAPASAPERPRIRTVDGKLLFWYGVKMPERLRALREVIRAEMPRR